MAALTVTPADGINVGEAVSVVGSGFLAATVCTIEIPDLGLAAEITSDAAGYFGTDDVADHATTTLTSSGVNVTADDAVTIGAVTYVFKASVTTTANEVKRGADAEASLANLKKAINLSGVAGTDYGSLTVVHPTVFAGVATATTLKLHAKTGGTAGNSLASTTTATTYSFPGATFNSGTPGSAATGVSAMLFHPAKVGTFTITGTDGTSTATTTVRVWS